MVNFGYPYNDIDYIVICKDSTDYLLFLQYWTDLSPVYKVRSQIYNYWQRKTDVKIPYYVVPELFTLNYFF